MLTVTVKSTEIKMEDLLHATSGSTSSLIRTNYKQTKVKLITDTTNYKSRHYHDFSIITTEKDLNEEYALHMLDHYYNDRQRSTTDPPHKQRMITFMIN
eukprot:88490-Amphidinium_carterae.1